MSEEKKNTRQISLPAARQEVNYSDYADSLSSYLRKIDHYPPLSVPEQEQLCREIDDCMQTLRLQLYEFGTVQKEHIHLLDECISNNQNPADAFLLSSLIPESSSDDKVSRSNFHGSRASLGALLPKLTEWRDALQKLYSKLEADFSAGLDVSATREELRQKLSVYAVSGDRITEAVQIIQGYVRLLAPEFDPEQTFHLPPQRTLRSEQVRLLENKFLFPLPELPEKLNPLLKTGRKLKTLQQKMIEANLRLVISIAQHYRSRGILFNDLIQEGNLGLLKALEKFDFKLQNKFSTYASWWIKHNITRAIAEQARVIRIPAHMLQAMNSINWAEQRFIQMNGREPENHELAAMLELPTARVSAIRKMASQPISLQAPIQRNGETTSLEELISAEDAETPDAGFARQVLYEKLYEMLNYLPEREQQIIILRFGLYGQNAQALSEISKRFNLTRERIRQLESKILDTLRSPEMIKHLDGFR